VRDDGEVGDNHPYVYAHILHPRLLPLLHKSDQETTVGSFRRSQTLEETIVHNLWIGHKAVLER
jgi:hypothetical protein